MYYVLSRDDSILIGVTTDDAYSFNLPNVSIHEMEGSIPDLNRYKWDFQSGEFVRSSDVLTKREFLNKFSIQERAAIRSSQDPIVIDVMNMLEVSEYIDLDNQDTVNSVGYLAMVGLLEQHRVQEVLQ